jgi:hypothetical protein
MTLVMGASALALADAAANRARGRVGLPAAVGARSSSTPLLVVQSSVLIRVIGEPQE